MDKVKAAANSRTYYERHKPEILARRRNHGERTWQCKCPICGSSHKKRLFWVGRSETPPINCMECERHIDNHGSIDPMQSVMYL